MSLSRILEIITLNIYTVQKKHNPNASKEFRLPLEKGKYNDFLSKIRSPFQNPNVKVSKENKTFTI